MLIGAFTVGQQMGGHGDSWSAHMMCTQLHGTKSEALMTNKRTCVIYSQLINTIP